MRQDFARLREGMTAREALDTLRGRGSGRRSFTSTCSMKIIGLVGVLPTRRLLTALPEQRIGDLMIQRVIAIPQSATLLEACEFFVLHKFFAFPVVDDERRILGLVDIGVFTERSSTSRNASSTRIFSRRLVFTFRRCATRGR
jgi:magnesium transporter